MIKEKAQTKRSGVHMGTKSPPERLKFSARRLSFNRRVYPNPDSFGSVAQIRLE